MENAAATANPVGFIIQMDATLTRAANYSTFSLDNGVALIEGSISTNRGPM